MVKASILWRRIDSPGHDACRLSRRSDGWQLDGTAVFREDGAPACLTYHVACDRSWRATRGEVRGWLGARGVSFSIVRSPAGVWTLNGNTISDVVGCVDLDLAVTPATNLSQLRRIALAEGQAADVPVAWLDAPAGTLSVLPQRYERRSPTTYWYEAPRFDYEALLEVGESGFVERYPGLWEAEPQI